MTQLHAIVWLDHHDARIIAFSLGTREVFEVHSERPERRIHRKAQVIGSGHAPDDHDFFDGIVEAVGDAREVLIAGPGTAKTAFATYVQDRHHDLAARVVGVETLDHPSDGELLVYAQKFFKGYDQLGLG